MNQRRRLLNLARKGDLKAINRLFELYQVRVYSGDNLKKVGRGPFAPPSLNSGKSNAKPSPARSRPKAAASRRRLTSGKSAVKSARGRKAGTGRTTSKARRRASHR